MRAEAQGWGNPYFRPQSPSPKPHHDNKEHGIGGTSKARKNHSYYTYWLFWLTFSLRYNRNQEYGWRFYDGHNSSLLRWSMNTIWESTAFGEQGLMQRPLLASGIAENLLHYNVPFVKSTYNHSWAISLCLLLYQNLRICLFNIENTIARQFWIINKNYVNTRESVLCQIYICICQVKTKLIISPLKKMLKWFLLPL